MKFKSPALRKSFISRGFVNALAALAMAATLVAQTEEVETEKKEEIPAEAKKPVVVLSQNREQLELPGIKVQIKERYVDVDATVCLTAGLLELVVCAKDTKEHESVIAIDAKAAHIHASLLLLGIKPGNPAMRKVIEGENAEDGRWIDLPPRGPKVDVFLVVKDEAGKPVERPISDFLMKDHDRYEVKLEGQEEAGTERFPTNTFLFAGSHVYRGGEGPPKYLADVDGNVISISTFGNELLCLPGVYTQGNEGLVWEVDSTHLPELGEKVILRLRPQAQDAPPAEKKD